MSALFQRRLYQRSVLQALPTRRFFCLLWRRQGGKSTTLSEAAIFGMMKRSGLTITYASASLLLGREIVFKESQVMAKAIAAHRSAKVKLEFANRETGKELPGIGADDLAELFESQRLEFRFWHDQTTFSRTQVIAPNPATARGWTGWVFLDEFGFIRDFRDLWEAVEPIVSTDPTFHLIMATTPPRDDSHYSYELTAPPLGTVFPADAAGNWYESEGRVPVHRVDVFDAHAAGVRLYDLRTGAEVTPQEHFAASDDKDAWRRNYKVEHVLGGTSACGLLQLETAQRRGVGQGACFVVDSDLDFERALAWVRQNLGPYPVGIGLDLATTVKETSNPTACALVEKQGVDLKVRAVLVWKTADPAVATERIGALIATVKDRPDGGPARKLCIDATNERYFAAAVRDAFAGELPVQLVIGSESVVRPGQEPMNWKQYLGSQLVGELDDNHLWLPPERYLREDFRLVKKERGAFVCEPDGQGRHGDTFDAVKLGLEAVAGSSGPIIYRAIERRTDHHTSRRVLA